MMHFSKETKTMIVLAFITVLFGLLSSLSTAKQIAHLSSIEKRLLQQRKLTLKNSVASSQRPHVPRTSAMIANRKLQSPCDFAFLSCLPNEDCLECFEQLGAKDINWAAVTTETSCSDVIDILVKSGHCVNLPNSGVGKDVFCDTFNSCIIWDTTSGSSNDPNNDEDNIDCSKLASCEWDGMHPSFLGDGICQKFGCYNSKVCNYDQGDCCEDTCKSTYGLCGVDGFNCQDPVSKFCDTLLNPECKASEPSKPLPKPACQAGEKLYMIKEYDSWGDGWDNTTLSIAQNGKELFSGHLKDGYEGVEYTCLGEGCFNVSSVGGLWGVEVSWEVRIDGGGPILAAGGSPMNCTFPLEGNFCPNTCVGMPSDPGGKALNDCIKDKCVLQLAACEGDPNCSPCLLNDSPSYCFTNNAYNDLVDCSICQCTDDSKIYCNEKKSPDANNLHECNAQQTMQGTGAVMSYSKCADIDSVAAIVTDWREDNFGALDDFERCSHEYNDSPTLNGHKALDCMKILHDIVSGETESADYIKNLAGHIYNKSQESCDCAVATNKDTPACNSFARFKTLLYETLDACKSLDEIDCAAWEEFSKPCKTNLQVEFGSINFSNSSQCKFVQMGCNGSGAFPAFRRLDCGKEISKGAWDFFNEYSKECVKGSGSGGDDTPIPVTPTTAPIAPMPIPSGGDASPSTIRTPKPTVPYVPNPNDPLSPGKQSASTSKSRRHPFLWLLVLGGVGFAVYKFAKRRRQTSAFDFVRYHRHLNTRDDELDAELFNERDTGSFEPPSVSFTSSARP